jgi:hypothetical protein
MLTTKGFPISYKYLLKPNYQIGKNDVFNIYANKFSIKLKISVLLDDWEPIHNTEPSRVDL